MAFVYHIHLPEHKGDFDFGYIGFTSNTVDSRWKDHLALAKTEKSRNYPIYHATRKYGKQLVVTTLLEGSNEFCLEMEFRLRPHPNMAWNISCGGGAPMLGLKHSEETLQKMRDVSDEKRKRQSDRARAIPTWLHGSSDKTTWASAEDIFCLYAQSPSIGANLLGQAFGVGIKKLEAMLNKFRAGWIPEQDSEWCEWAKSIPTRLSGWAEGDEIPKYKAPELTKELREARAEGGRKRVWTEEMKQNLRVKNTGRKMPPEAVLKSALANTGKRRTAAQKEEIRKRLNTAPWTNATAIKTNWAAAESFKEALDAGNTEADLLRRMHLPRKSGALSKIVRKIKSGWIPSQDPLWCAFKEEYDKNEEPASEIAPAN